MIVPLLILYITLSVSTKPVCDVAHLLQCSLQQPNASYPRYCRIINYRLLLRGYISHGYMFHKARITLVTVLQCYDNLHTFMSTSLSCRRWS